jgi:hypothetical protein
MRYLLEEAFKGEEGGMEGSKREGKEGGLGIGREDKVAKRMELLKGALVS